MELKRDSQHDNECFESARFKILEDERPTSLMLNSAMLYGFAHGLGDGEEAWKTAEANKEASVRAETADTILCCCLVNVPMEPRVLERVDNLSTCE